MAGGLWRFCVSQADALMERAKSCLGRLLTFIGGNEDRAARSMALATWIIAIFTIILALATWSTLTEIRTGGADTRKVADQAVIQAEAAASAADTAATTLRVSQRPWIVAEKFTIVDIGFEPPAGQIFSILGTVTFSNMGHSVASNGLSYFWILPNRTTYLEKRWNAPCEFTSEQRDMIAHSDHNPWPVGFLLAPGEPVDIDLKGVGIDVPTRRHPGEGITVFPDMIKRGDYYLIGCTLYEDEFAHVHKTQWCFTPKRDITGNGAPTTPLALVNCQAFQVAD